MSASWVLGLKVCDIILGPNPKYKQVFLPQSTGLIGLGLHYIEMGHASSRGSCLDQWAVWAFSSYGRSWKALKRQAEIHVVSNGSITSAVFFDKCKSGHQAQRVELAIVEKVESLLNSYATMMVAYRRPLHSRLSQPFHMSLLLLL